MSAIFSARYSSDCNMCSGRITPGTRIVRVGEGAYSHLNCNPHVNQGWMPGRGPAQIPSGTYRNQNGGGWSS